MDINTTQAAKIANFVDFAYNMYAVGGLTPPPDPGIAAAGYQLLYYIDAYDFDENVFYGYIAGSTTNPGDIVIAIRGTEDPSEWLLDFLAIPVPFTPALDAGFVALGFELIYDSFQLVDTTGASTTLTGAVTAIASKAPITSLLLVGHSLGAALSTLAAADLSINNPAGVQSVLTSYTFASPRVGLADFASTFDKVVNASYRVWNTLDIVPEVPPPPYYHVSGFGDPIFQTVQQLETLVFSVACEHHLTSYQWLLDAADFPLGADCTQATNPVLAAAAAAGAGVPLATRQAAATTLRKATRGRLLQE